MKKIFDEEHHVMHTSDDFPMTPHIHLLRIRAFASESIDFTQDEDAHFDACRVCRLNLIDALRNVSPEVVTITTNAA